MNPSTKALRWAALAAIALATTVAHAAVFVQNVPFNFTASGATTTSVLVNSGDFTGTVAPFNPGLGTLNSFDVAWHITYTLNFVNDASGTSKYSYIANGGTLVLNGESYSGAGGSKGGGGAPNASYSVTLQSDLSNSFAVANANVTYSPFLLASVTGGSSFAVAYRSSTTPVLGNVSSWDASAVGSVEVSYNYTAVPEPAEYAAVTGLALGVFALVQRRRQAAGR